MEEELVSTIYYRLHLLTNLANEPETGGTLVVDTYTFNPRLEVGDEIEIQDFRVSVFTETRISNQSFSFLARVMRIQKIVLRHQSFIVDIYLESPNRETVNQIRAALIERNPGQI
ncbi:hypothetical protein [Picosynechococcus sp. PCC 73109]|uniref:hypothetical protein n=1 Tax=Picosynechococcus sp. PCC 73109 TaxID=374982 RepID=UPI000745911C|nr:hypothetical protein [Picosynechococcus sp. PCC 73109]AMA08912.1 hypothetical protein AWQ23_06070 [Picosynechococcus sp. PCC 73109]